MMGREKETGAEAAEVLRINPKFSLDYYAKRLAYNDQLHADKLITALRKAGLSEILPYLLVHISNKHHSVVKLQNDA